tara:strand:- start:123 stop:350 length:228 start_codon:yes stop_codon:yes gene_type:complete
MKLRLNLLALMILGILVGITYGIQWIFPQLSNQNAANIGFIIFLVFMASLIWFDYGIDWDTYKFKNKSKKGGKGK